MPRYPRNTCGRGITNGNLPQYKTKVCVSTVIDGAALAQIQAHFPWVGIEDFHYHHIKLKEITNNTVSVEFRNRFFTPFNLNNSFLQAEETVIGERAHGWYDVDDDGIVDDINNYPATALYSIAWTAGAIISEAALSFLGLGIQPPTASWGNILRAGKDVLNTAPHVATISGLFILTTVLGFNLLGDGIRDVFDPKMKR